MPEHADDKPRCHWCAGDPEMTAYHDDEWGVPISGDDDYLERMLLEVFQAGLSWRTILHKRPAFRQAFQGFSVDRVASFGTDDIARLLTDAGIVRHRGKIEASIENARRFQQIRADYGSFHDYLAALDDDRIPFAASCAGDSFSWGPRLPTVSLKAWDAYPLHTSPTAGGLLPVKQPPLQR